jgi:hypothetical protein
MEFPCYPEKETETYFSEPLILANWVLRFEPRPLITAMMASAIPAAIRPYSIAVAPDSSEKNSTKYASILPPLDFQGGILWRHQDKARTSKAVLIRAFNFNVVLISPRGLRWRGQANSPRQVPRLAGNATGPAGSGDTALCFGTRHSPADSLPAIFP